MSCDMCDAYHKINPESPCLACQGAEDTKSSPPERSPLARLDKEHPMPSHPSYHDDECQVCAIIQHAARETLERAEALQHVSTFEEALGALGVASISIGQLIDVLKRHQEHWLSLDRHEEARGEEEGGDWGLQRPSTE